MLTRSQIDSTSKLIQAAKLLGAKYSTDETFANLTLADNRCFNVATHNNTWHFDPLWSYSAPLVVSVDESVGTLKDLILQYTVLIRGPIATLKIN